MADNDRLGALEGLAQALTLLVERSPRRQKDLAPAIGIAPPSLSRILTGRNRPTAHTLGLLLEELGCTLWDLAAALDEVTGRKSPQRLDGPLLLAVLPIGDLLRTRTRQGLMDEALAQVLRDAVKQHLEGSQEPGASSTEQSA